jgi:hypothetical protein
MSVTVREFEPRLRALQAATNAELEQWLRRLAPAALAGDLDAQTDALWAAMEPDFIPLERVRLERLLELVPLWQHLLGEATPVEWESYGKFITRLQLESYEPLLRSAGLPNS